MITHSPGVDPLPRFSRYQGFNEEVEWRNSIRVKLFSVIAGVVLVSGIVWTLLQPIVYRSSATVLMSAPSAIDASNCSASKGA